MMRKLFVLLAFIPCLTFGQLTEDFTDGNFTNNPVWSGDASEFIVNGAQQLQLNAAVAGISYLSVGNNSATLDNTTWQFFIHLNFSPSSNNYARVYLVSDQSNLEGPLNGYYLQFGEDLSNDPIELFKQTGTTSTSVASGTSGFVSSAFTISVQVTRDNSGNWNILADPAAGTNFILQVTGNDNTYNSSSFFGVVCKYTASNIANFYFDDFIIPYTPDVTPPSVSTISVISSNQVDVLFSEPVEQTSAEDELNYSVDNGIGNPSSAIRDGGNISLVHLTFATNFVNGITNTLSVINVEDLSGNAITTASTGTFTWFAPIIPAKYDVVINEILFEPFIDTPLPDEEYVEIFNRSNKVLNLNGWTLNDGTSSIAVIGNIQLKPDSFLILCSSTNVNLFTSFGAVFGTTSFPALNNDTGDDLKLFDNSGQLIDEVIFNDESYHDPLKDSKGWSIEKIDPNFTCPNSLNWKASVNPIGGTPGSINSVGGIFSDTQSPLLLRASVVDATHVKVYFDEPMNETMLASISSFTIDNSIGNPVSVSVQADVQSAVLTLLQTIQQGIIYHITVLSSITDCAGNTLEGNNTVRFAIPDSIISVSDILINEVLFNPKDDGKSFVELYNRSNKIFDLSQLKIAALIEGTDTINSSTIKNISAEGYLFFPGDYVAVTESPADIKSRYNTTNPAGFLIMDGLESILSTVDGTVLIIDFSFNRIDQFFYTEDYHFPLLNDPEGVSLERISFNRATQDSTNWHSAAESVGFATPAYENSQHAETIDDGSEVSVVPEIFSPDNDGMDDVVNILYHFGSPGYTANLKIFDSKGRLVIDLIKNQLLGTGEGSFIWDGITDENEKARIGIHVIYLEVFNAEGTVKKFKKPVVVATRF
ncbi:MAG: lamin tail domain-containing protein [Bacteroidia bacterium]